MNRNFGKPLKAEDLEDLKRLLAEREVPVQEFAVDARVHLNTAYFALKGLPLKERTHRRISMAIDRLRAVAAKTAG